MKNSFRTLLVLTLISAAPAMALSPPKPVTGFPSIMSGRGTHFHLRDKIISVKAPQGWGIGDTSLSSEDKTSYLSLFPSNGDYGCTIQIDRYPDESAAAAALEKVKHTFSSVKPIQNGFEVDLKKAWFSCKQSSTCVVQMWYSLPKKKSDSLKKWQSLKDCVSIEPIEVQEPVPVELSNQPAVEKRGFDWVCHHPENKIDLFFKTLPFWESNGNTDPSKLYSVEFKDIMSDGYFYVKWDQADCTHEAVYHDFLKEILADLKGIDSAQQARGKAIVNLDQKLAFWKGSPYTIVIVSADDSGFLFGFALQQSIPHLNVDWDSYIQRVSWTTR